MISNLRVYNHKALKAATLKNLGKTNVICGPNNSGKTTILERIASGKETNLGESLTAEARTYFTNMFSTRDQVNVLGSKMPIEGFLTRSTDLTTVIKRTLDGFSVLFQDDWEAFSEEFLLNAVRVHKERLQSKRYQYDLVNFLQNEKFAKPFREVFNEVVKRLFDNRFGVSIHPDNTVLVTPKRQIHPAAPINPAVVVEHDGNGLLGRLFFLKSALPETSGRQFFEKFWHAFQTVTGSYKFDIEIASSSNDLRLNFSTIGSNLWRYAEDCGLGLRELMVILYFAVEQSKSLVLIEEPENHLHPEMQRRLLRFLKEDTTDKKQFILSTHSSVFIDELYVDRVFQTSLDDGVVTIDDATSKARVLNDLGYLTVDNLVSDLVIVVEGSGDKKALIEFLNKMGLMGPYNIRFWTLNGDAMVHLDLESFSDRFKILVLLDNDPGSEAARKPFMQQCKRLSIPVTKLKRYSIENYYPLDVYRRSFGELIPKKIKELNPKEPVWAQLGSRIKRSDIKKGSGTFAARTDLNAIEETDLGKFLSDVRATLKDQSTRS